MDAELAPVGITVAQFGTLAALAANPGQSSAELARACSVSPQSMAALVRRLEAEGWAARRPDSRHGRVIELRVTPRGRAALARAAPIVDRVEAQVVLADLSEADQRVLRQALTGLIERVGAGPV